VSQRMKIRLIDSCIVLLFAAGLAATHYIIRYEQPRHRQEQQQKQKSSPHHPSASTTGAFLFFRSFL